MVLGVLASGPEVPDPPIAQAQRHDTGARTSFVLMAGVSYLAARILSHHRDVYHSSSRLRWERASWGRRGGNVRLVSQTSYQAAPYRRIYPANGRVTDGDRTRDLRSHNPPNPVSSCCCMLQNRLI